MIDIAFDQYQRYKTTEIIVNALKEYHKLKSIKIIEVGANEHKNLEKFLDKDDIYYLDINIPKNLENDSRYILGDATNLVNIRDNEYDMVVALDVYEHIPDDKREDFLKELDRVSKYGVMICAPFNYKHVEDAEVRANEYFKSLTGENFIWLKEHIDEKLPSIDKTNDIIRNMNRKLINFEHGDIYLWEKLIKCHFFSAEFRETTGYRTLIDKFYNTNIFLNDVGNKNYRTFIVYSVDELCINFVDDILNSHFIKGYDLKDLNLLNELTRELDHIGYTNRINNINRNQLLDEPQYELVYYIKDEITGNYTEENSIKKTIDSKRVIDRVQILEMQKFDEIRIDPISSNCIISNLNIYTVKDNSRIDLNIKYTNCDIKFEDIYFFGTNDPQIYVDINNIEVDSLFLSYDLIDYDDKSINDMVSILIKHKLRIDKITKKIENTTREVEILNKKIVGKDDRIELLNQSVLNKDQEIDLLKQSLLCVEEKINRIENSRLYKVIFKIKSFI